MRELAAGRVDKPIYEFVFDIGQFRIETSNAVGQHCNAKTYVTGDQPAGERTLIEPSREVLRGPTIFLVGDAKWWELHHRYDR